MEVLFTISRDNGWSFSRPYVVDSFVGPDPKGTYVAIGAREGLNRPEFALGWAVDEQAFRIAPIDLRSRTRPDSFTVGYYNPGEMKIEVCGTGRDGLVSAFREGSALRTARIKPLTGGVDEAVTVNPKIPNRLFTLAARYRGPAVLTFIDRNTIIALEYRGGRWHKILSSPLPATLSSSPITDLRSDLDDDRNIHLAIRQGDIIYHMAGHEHRWSPPEKVLSLQPDLPSDGFDIAVTDEFIYICAAQRQTLQIKRKSLR